MIIMMFLSRQLQINPMFVIRTQNVQAAMILVITVYVLSYYPHAECHLVKVDCQTSEKHSPGVVQDHGFHYMCTCTASFRQDVSHNIAKVEEHFVHGSILMNHGVPHG